MNNTFPLFEHDVTEGRNAMSRPPLAYGDGSALPSRCLISFMGDALERFVKAHGCAVIDTYHSEVRDFPIYEDEYNGVACCLVQGPVGAPAAAILADLLIASEVETIVACGGCGTIVPIESGRILVPICALRDEGTSFHYIEPSREIELDESATHIALSTLEALGIRHQPCKVWTCDGFFRETPGMVALRRDQGCDAVDMECSALAAVCRAYGASFAQLFYSGDSLADPDNHDERDWIANHNARDITLRASLEVLARL